MYTAPLGLSFQNLVTDGTFMGINELGWGDKVSFGNTTAIPLRVIVVVTMYAVQYRTLNYCHNSRIYNYARNGYRAKYFVLIWCLCMPVVGTYSIYRTIQNNIANKYSFVRSIVPACTMQPSI